MVERSFGWLFLPGSSRIGWRARSRGGFSAPAALGLLLLLLAAGRAAAGFDHVTYDALLKARVDDAGMVDYAGLLKSREPLDDYLSRMASAKKEDLLAWPRNEQLAFYINAYNAITLARIIDNYPPKGLGILNPKISIRNIDGVWTKIQSTVAGEVVTLDDIEHKILRGIYKEPRIHVAIVCASVSCPRLTRDAYLGDRLEDQLERQSEEFARTTSRNRIDVVAGIVGLSPIFSWFKADFEAFEAELSEEARTRCGNLAGGVGFLARHGNPATLDFLKKGDYKVELLDYDWGLNGK